MHLQALLVDSGRAQRGQMAPQKNKKISLQNEVLILWPQFWKRNKQTGEPNIAFWLIFAPSPETKLCPLPRIPFLVPPLTSIHGAIGVFISSMCQLFALLGNYAHLTTQADPH